jgi:hypothetical protein
MRGRTLARIAAVVQLCLLAGALGIPSSVAAASFDFTLNAPSLSTVQYSDLVVLKGSYTCTNDDVSTCPTTTQSRTATFSVRPSGGDTFSSVGTVTSSFVFTSNPAGCVTTCTFNFQLTWKAGRALTVTTPPGVYDIGLTTTIAGGQQILTDAITLTRESSNTTYTGGTAGQGDTDLTLAGNVTDADLGQAVGTGIITPDTNLLGAGLMTFELFDSTNTTSVVGPVSATVLSNGNTTGSPVLHLPAAGGTYALRTTFVGNAFYTTSADLDTVTVTASNTPPVLTVPDSPLLAEASSPSGAYRTFTVSATDAEDVPAPAPSCDHESGDLFPIGDTIVSCSVTDSGDMGDSDSFTVRVVDTTDPVMNVTTDESDNGGGWYNIASNDEVPGVTVEAITADLVGVTALTCTVDGEDVGFLDPSGDSFAVGDGSHTVWCTATDAAGNHHSDSATFDVDQTAPSISASVSPDADAATGWWNVSTGAPTATFTCDDAGSGLASCSPDHPFGDGAGQSTTGTATDLAGNTASSSVSDVNVDRTAPVSIALTGGGVADGASYVFGSVPDGPTGCTASEDISGIAACVTSGYSPAVGSQTITALATDGAGNTSSTTVTYTVLPWTLVGFSNPISMASFNVVKAGSSANLKFQVFAGAVEQTSTEAISAFTQTQISCTTLAAIGPTTSALLSRGASLKYASQFQAKWDPPSVANTCWRVAIETADGTSLSADFQLK